MTANLSTLYVKPNSFYHNPIVLGLQQSTRTYGAAKLSRGATQQRQPASNKMTLESKD